MNDKRVIHLDQKLSCLRFQSEPGRDTKAEVFELSNGARDGDPGARLKVLLRSISNYRNSGKVLEAEQVELDELEQMINAALELYSAGDYKALAGEMIFIGYRWGFFEVADGWHDNLKLRFSNMGKARKKRPSRRHSLKTAVLALMKKHKREDITFSSFLSTWRTNPLDGLRLERVGKAKREQEQKYKVFDERPGADEQSQPYAYSTLQSTFWAQCDK